MRLRSLVVAASLLFATQALAEHPNPDLEVVSQYVLAHKHWPAKVFRVERKDCDCAYALYRVIYLPEEGKPVATNSKSFAVYYDEQLHRVVKETQFQ